MELPLSMTVAPFSAATISNMLVQHKLPMIDRGCSMGDTALAHMLADSRLDMSIPSERRKGMDHTKIRIYQTSVDALKIFLFVVWTNKAGP